MHIQYLLYYIKNYCNLPSPAYVYNTVKTKCTKHILHETQGKASDPLSEISSYEYYGGHPDYTISNAAVKAKPVEDVEVTPKITKTIGEAGQHHNSVPQTFQQENSGNCFLHVCR